MLSITYPYICRHIHIFIYKKRVQHPAQAGAIHCILSIDDTPKINKHGKTPGTPSAHLKTANLPEVHCQKEIVQRVNGITK